MTIKHSKANPKILLFDIENFPNLAYVWQQRIDGYIPDNMMKDPWYMAMWSAKWLGDKKVMNKSLIDYPDHYKKHPTCDKMILQDLWNLLDEADIVIGHNAKAFDIKKSNARFIMNGMKPPSPYKVVDTLQIARSKFFFTSNKLDNLGQYLGVGEKIETGGFKLWEDCMLGKKSAWRKFKKYCNQDVNLLEKVYLKLLPYATNHPNIGSYIDDNQPHCTNCGSPKLQKRGTSTTSTGRYQRYQCQACGAYGRGKENLRREKDTVTESGKVKKGKIKKVHITSSQA